MDLDLEGLAARAAAETEPEHVSLDEYNRWCWQKLIDLNAEGSEVEQQISRVAGDTVTVRRPTAAEVRHRWQPRVVPGGVWTEDTENGRPWRFSVQAPMFLLGNCETLGGFVLNGSVFLCGPAAEPADGVALSASSLLLAVRFVNTFRHAELVCSEPMFFGDRLGNRLFVVTGDGIRLGVTMGPAVDDRRSISHWSGPKGRYAVGEAGTVDVSDAPDVFESPAELIGSYRQVRRRVRS